MKTLMQPLVFILLVLFLIAVELNAQEFLWAKNISSSADSISSTGLAVDAMGNTFITGYFVGTASFGTIQLTSYGGKDIFVAKYDSNGNCIWAKNAGSPYDDEGTGISVDTMGNSYITGGFIGMAMFGTIRLISYGPYGYSDIFVAKYDLTGNCLWANQAGSSSAEKGTGISVDAVGNSFVIGYFFNTATFATIQIESTGLSDIFIAKYSPGGNILWVIKAGGTNYDKGYALTMDKNRNIYLTGIFAGTSLFGSVYLTSYSSDYYDIFIAKLNSAGNFLWAKNAGSVWSDQSKSIAVDQNGNSFITGSFVETATFGTIQLASYGAGDIFVAKYDSFGNCLWAKNAGSIEASDEGNGISCDSSGNSYVTGDFKGAVTFGSILFTSYGSWDIFIAKFAPDGNCLWANKAGGYDTDFGLGIKTDASGTSYVSGRFHDAALFGQILLGPNGGAFVAKIKNSPTNIGNDANAVPNKYTLLQNYPNPFNPNTKLSYSIIQSGLVTLKVFDVLGNEIEKLVNEEKPVGTYEITWYAESLPSGVYFYQLRVGEFVETKKMILLK